MRVIIFNGPPGSGKDEACIFFKNIGYVHLSFKDQLFKETFDFFNVSKHWFMEGYEIRKIKEKPVSQLMVNDLMLSRRDAMIHVSENIIKPKYGKSYFGLKISEQIVGDMLYCISDGGFEEELSPIINKIGAENIAIVQLTREGCDFSSDSRRYINGVITEEFVLDKKTEIQKHHVLDNKFPIRTYRVHNNSSIEDFHAVLQLIHEKENNGREIIKKEKNGKAII